MMKKSSLNCLNPVRVLSVRLIYLGHTNLARALNSPIFNYLNVLPSISNLYLIVILCGSFAVDAFFWQSGFLKGY